MDYRLKDIKEYTDSLTKKYEGRVKPIDTECYMLLRSIGKYLVWQEESRQPVTGITAKGATGNDQNATKPKDTVTCFIGMGDIQEGVRYAGYNKVWFYLGMNTRVAVKQQYDKIVTQWIQEELQIFNEINLHRFLYFCETNKIPCTIKYDGGRA